MLTSSIGTPAGPLGIGHHTGVKCSVITGPQIYAFSGGQALSGRFQLHAETVYGSLAAATHPLFYAVNVCQRAIADFASTGLPLHQVDLATVLAYVHGGNCHCCVFEGLLQPRLLDSNHFYASIGSGKLSADPFLRFVVDTFCQPGRPPGVHLATFLAVWVVQHVVDVNPGGVAEPIRVAVFERDTPGPGYSARELPPTEIAAHKAAIDDAAEALRAWRNNIQSGAAAGGVVSPPIAPATGSATSAGTAPELSTTGPPGPSGPGPGP